LNEESNAGLFLSYLIEVNVVLKNIFNKEDGRIIMEDNGIGMTLDLS
jgi:HSP90 family molecular chaperone